MTTNGPTPRSTRDFGRAAATLVAAMADDSAEFARLVEQALVEGRDPVLREAVARMPANRREEAALTISQQAETLPLRDKQVGRLIAIPALVHPEGLDCPDAAGILAALRSSGLVPDEADIAVEPRYWDAPAVAALDWSARRLLLDQLTSGITPATLLLQPAAARWHRRRGMRAVVLATLILPEGQSIELLDGEELQDGPVRELQLAVLRTGRGLVDLAPPMRLQDIGGAGAAELPWLVESSGALEEVAAFFAAAADALGEDQVACTVRRAGPRLEVRLRNRQAALVDERDFLPLGESQIAMTMAELRRCVTEVALAVTVLPDWDGLADFARDRPPYIPPRRAAGVRPMAIAGGRILREQEEEARTYAGMRRRLDEMRANSPLKNGGPASA